MRGYLIAAAAGLLLALATVAGVKWYGRHQYAAGQAQEQLQAAAATTKLSEQYRSQEQAAQQQSEEEYAKYRGQVLATQKRAADLDVAAGRLRAQLASLQSRRAAEVAQPVGGPDAGAGPDFIGVIGACAARYESVVDYAGRLADQVTGLQGYINGALGTR
jgi:hypothetical protein